MLADPRAFSLGAILSVTTGRLLADIGDVHELLDFMTGDVLMTHQLPRAMDETTPAILRQHPDLAEVIAPADFDDAAHVSRWLADFVATLGPDRYLRPLEPGEHQRIHPLVELAAMAPGKPVIVVAPAVSDVD